MSELEFILEEEKQRVRDLEILVRNLQESEKRLEAEMQQKEENWKHKVGEMVEKYMDMESERDVTWDDREDEMATKLEELLQSKKEMENSLRRSLGEWEQKGQSWSESEGEQEKWKKKKGMLKEKIADLENILDRRTTEWEIAHADIVTIEAQLVDSQHREAELERELAMKEDAIMHAELEMKREIEQREVEWTEVLATKIQELLDRKEGEWQTKELSLRNELEKMVEEFHTMGEMRERELREKEAAFHQALSTREFEWKEREEEAREDLARSMRMRDDELKLTESQIRKEFDQLLRSSETQWKGIFSCHFIIYIFVCLFI